MFNDLQDKLLHQFLLLYAGPVILTLRAAQICVYVSVYACFYMQGVN